MPVFARLILKVTEDSKESAEKKLNNEIEGLKKEENIHIYKCNPMPAEEDNNKWSAVSEIELETTDFNKLRILFTKYTPLSIEILEPLKFEFSSYEFAETINGLLEKIKR